MKEMQETQSLGQEDPLEKGMATHSSTLTWRIPMDRGAWQATVHGVPNSQTWLTMPTAAADRYMIERKIIDIDKLWASYAKDNCLFPHWLATVARILCCCRSAVERRVRPHRQQPTRLPRPWDSPGKNTGVGRHCLLQCMKVKRESEVAQSCPTPRDPMDCGLPGSSAHGIFQARGLEWGAIAFSPASSPYPQTLWSVLAMWQPSLGTITLKGCGAWRLPWLVCSSDQDMVCQELTRSSVDPPQPRSSHQTAAVRCLAMSRLSSTESQDRAKNHQGNKQVTFRDKPV